MTYREGVFDTHVHLDDPRFDADRDRVVARAREAGVRLMLVPGIDAGQWARGREVAQRYGFLHAVGTHPHACVTHPEVAGSAAAAALPPRPWLPDDVGDAAAIGECGLDARIAAPMERQEEVLRAHLARARDTGLPLVLHCVGAHARLLAVLRSFGTVRGVLHGYSGGPGFVGDYVRAGLHLGFGGAVTRENAPRVVEALRRVPRDRLLAESDAPDQPTRLRRGTTPDGTRPRGEPADLVEVVRAMEAVRGEPLAGALAENAAALGWGAAA